MEDVPLPYMRQGHNERTLLEKLGVEKHRYVLCGSLSANSNTQKEESDLCLVGSFDGAVKAAVLP